jgi:hypothetical protein
MEENKFITRATIDCLEDAVWCLTELGFNVERVRELKSLPYIMMSCSYAGETLEKDLAYAKLLGLEIEKNKRYSI